MPYCNGGTNHIRYILFYSVGTKTPNTIRNCLQNGRWLSVLFCAKQNWVVIAYKIMSRILGIGNSIAFDYNTYIHGLSDRVFFFQCFSLHKIVM